MNEIKVIPIGFCGAVYSEDKMVILGSAGAGKDTVKDEILELISRDGQYNLSDSRRLAINLADPIKELCCTKFGLKMSDFHQSKKNIIIDELGYSPRQLAQLEGTEYGRMAYGDNIWINTLIRRARIEVEEYDVGYAITYVGDVRFMNEAKWVRENGLLIHVTRDCVGYDLATDTNHVSEKQTLEYVEGDVTFMNSSDRNLIQKNIIKSRLLDRINVRLKELIK